MKVRFTSSGRSQFLAALAYIYTENPDAARRFRKRAGRVLKRLERFPNSGRPLSEFPELPYREVVVPPYRFFYRIENKTAWIVGVWHGAQLPKKPQGIAEAMNKS